MCVCMCVGAGWVVLEEVVTPGWWFNLAFMLVLVKC